MKRLSCCFIGNYRIEEWEDINKKLKKVILRLVNRGVRDFYFGNRADFDGMAWLLVTELQKKYSDIRRIYLMSNDADPDEHSLKTFLPYFEDIRLPQDGPDPEEPTAIIRNRLMMKHSDFCIFHYPGPFVPDDPDELDDLDDGPLSTFIREYMQETEKSYNIAQSMNKEIINVF